MNYRQRLSRVATGGKGVRPAPRDRTALVVCGMVLASAAAALPLTQFGAAIGSGIAARGEFAFLQQGRQKLLAAVFGGGAPPAAPSAPALAARAAPDKFTASVSAIAALVSKMHEPEVGLSGSRLGDALAAIAAAPRAEPAKPAEPLLFRRIAQYGLSNNVDFDPTASTGAGGERLPPLARARFSTPGLLKQISEAVRKRGGKAAPVAEFAAKAFVPGQLFEGSPALRMAGDAGLPPKRQSTGRKSGGV